MHNVEDFTDIVIVGGGTAGWMTALFAKKEFPYLDVTLIESEELGIVGAGEGTTPHFVSFMDYLGLDISEFINLTGATIKNGIKFTDWNLGHEIFPEKPYYYHNFGALDPEISMELQSEEEIPRRIWQTLRGRILPYEFDFSAVLNENNKTPFFYTGRGSLLYTPPSKQFSTLNTYGIHMDAKAVAGLLKDTAVSRGVIRVEGIVTKVNLNENNYVESLTVNDSIDIRSNFVFDCSGFRRLLIGKTFNSEWVDLSEKLTVDSALPFFLPIESTEEIPTYTESIAMKYGWMWKIPLQHRYGCGYVFDSKYISDEEAKKEIEDKLGHSVVFNNKITFKAGYYQTPWVKNCIAVGMSATFAEPLEATSIWSAIKTLQLVKAYKYNLLNLSEKEIERFNNKLSDFNSEIFEFLYFHYMSKRDDTDFWKQYKDEKNIPNFVNSILEILKESLPLTSDFSKNSAFVLYSWLAIAFGNQYISFDIVEKMCTIHDIYLDDFFMDFRKKQRQKSRYCLSMRELMPEMNRQFND